MKTWFWILATMAFLSACNKAEDPCGKPDSSCIDEKIEAFKKTEGALAVYRYQVDGDYHYWFHDGAVAWDGVEHVYNTDCEEVCFFCGECLQSACADKYPANQADWTLIWWKK